MTAVSGQQLSVGLRYATVFPLDANGYPNTGTTGATAYEGLEFGGPRAFELSVPDVRRISHVGNDRVLALDFLPPTESMSGALRIARHEQSINATLMGVTEFTVAEKKNVAWATDVQGYEPDVALFLFQQSLDASTKLRRWRFIIIPKARIIPSLSGMNENASEVLYAIAPSPSTKHIWGTSLTVGTEGVTEVTVIEGMSEDRPKIVAWKGDNIVTKFLFPTSKPASSATKILFWKDGVLDGGVAAVDGVTPTVKPTSGQMVISIYEF